MTEETKTWVNVVYTATVALDEDADGEVNVAEAQRDAFHEAMDDAMEPFGGGTSTSTLERVTWVGDHLVSTEPYGAAACARCGKNPADGKAGINLKRYCLPDLETFDPSCYELAQRDALKQLAKSAAFFGWPSQKWRESMTKREEVTQPVIVKPEPGVRIVPEPDAVRLARVLAEVYNTALEFTKSDEAAASILAGIANRML